MGRNKGQGTGVRGTNVFLFWAVQYGEGSISTCVTIVYSQGSIGFLTKLQSTKRRASYPYRSVEQSCLPVPALTGRLHGLHLKMLLMTDNRIGI